MFVFINHNHVITLMDFLRQCPLRSHMQKNVIMSLKGQTFSKSANGLSIYDLKKKLTPGVILTLPWGYIHIYDYDSRTSVFVQVRFISSVHSDLFHTQWHSSTSSWPNFTACLQIEWLSLSI